MTTTYGTDCPKDASQSHGIGDLVINTNGKPDPKYHGEFLVDHPYGWLCVSAGSPGEWLTLLSRLPRCGGTFACVEPTILASRGSVSTDSALEELRQRAHIRPGWWERLCGKLGKMLGKMLGTKGGRNVG